ncbi:MAG: DEAD/DEAH box helicase, partial [Chlamydiae bacterium]|nr:DEAD/DEAH box helicase [Chlamydiota bacterium]
MLQYILSFQETNLIVTIEEKGIRRNLYWDVLTKIALPEDKEALLFFRKILTRFSQNLETLAFNRIEVSPKEILEAMRCLSLTCRVIYNKKPLLCDWKGESTLFFRSSDSRTFSPFLKWREKEIPLESCERIFSGFVLFDGSTFPVRSSISWKWIEFFKKGTRYLEDVEKKRFFDEEPVIQYEKKEEIPRLLLTDFTGSFANLSKDEPTWEKDLLEVGFEKKIRGSSHYFCPNESLYDALLLLLEVGWEIFLPGGKRLYRQTDLQWEIAEKKGNIAISANVSFQDKKTTLRSFSEGFQKRKLFVDLDAGSIGLIDRKKGVLLEGSWEGETLITPRTSIGQLQALLDLPEVKWEEKLRKAIQGLTQTLPEVLLDDSFQGALLPHQKKGVDWLHFLYRSGFSGLLADEMGLGKTVQALAFFSLLRTNLPILVVAPASLLYQWRSEIQRFLPKCKCLIYAGKDRILEGLSQEIVICSYAILREDEMVLSKIQWEVILLDESQAIKTASTETAKAAFKLKGHFRIALSGTPMENRVEELISQFQFLLPGLISDPKTIKPFILRRKKDSLDLPEKIEEICYIEMEESQSEIY